MHHWGTNAADREGTLGILVKGNRFNESMEFPDTATGRRSRLLAGGGLYNEAPTYHLNAAITADSRAVVFATMREGRTALCKVDIESGDCTVLAVGPDIPGYDESRPKETSRLGTRITGNHSAISQAGGFAVFVLGRSLRMVDLDSLQEKVLIDDIGEHFTFGNPVVTADGRRVLVTRVPQHPAALRGELPPVKGFYEEFARIGRRPAVYLDIDVATGALREPFREEIVGSNHVQPSPQDADLWLIDRDFPPGFGHGGDGGKTSRAWLLDIRTGKLTELRPRNANRFQIHTNWNPAGDRIYYHGRSGPGGMYVGVSDTEGHVIWEHELPVFHYGHVSVHTCSEAILTDGLVGPDSISVLHYPKDRDSGAPHVELLGRHGSLWGQMPEQFSHPHCHMSPDGRFVVYNRGEERCSQVCALTLG